MSTWNVRGAAKPMARTQPPAGSQADALRQLPAILAELGVHLDEAGLALLRTHFQLLVRWNRRVNLTSIRDPSQILRRHFAESLFLTKVVSLGPGLLYDVGSGAGFPGLPLKSAHPELSLVLVESSQKKAAFLKEVVRATGLEGVRVEATRAEELARRPDRELAHWLTTRAVGQTAPLLPLLRQLLLPQGQIALFLGAAAADRASKLTGFDWREPVRVPGSERRVILVGRVAER